MTSPEARVDVTTSRERVRVELGRLLEEHTADLPAVDRSPTVDAVPSFAEARALAELTLAEHLPDRWRHTQAVVREAVRLSALPEVDREPLLVAAVLHDVGYSPVVARTGFHPLDGARFLRTRGYDARCTAVVAHHSAAAVEARVRGLDHELRRYDDEATPTRDALWWCAAVCGPTGDPTTPDDRWTEIRRRYGPDHAVTRFLDGAEPQLRAAVARTGARLVAAGLAPAGPDAAAPDAAGPDATAPDAAGPDATAPDAAR
ncbi:HD domain-containing protein [Actinomycetospora sp. TBRC 11914]|uniref:HD domain-containing protein n=1 Tax=Actinomycetospora sp. TBRC 11914 TaxID=2729387 RepID=UPI00200707E4|nr:HD domain-containing protein [Actinomycetospora sp. TBRC 11914]